MFEFLKKLVKKKPKPKKVVAKPAPKPKKVVAKPAPKPKKVVAKPAPKPKKVVAKPAPKPKKVVAKPAPKPKEVVAKPAPKPKETLENDFINKKNSLPEDEPFQKKKGFFNFTKKIKEGLAKTREKLTTPLSELFSSQKIDESFYDELEMILLTSDVGISATEYLIHRVKEAVSKNNIVEPRDLKQILKDELVELLQVG
jgi:fused signal recognition particle receptor